jgi:hypothetical protein
MKKIWTKIIMNRSKRTGFRIILLLSLYIVQVPNYIMCVYVYNNIIFIIFIIFLIYYIITICVRVAGTETRRPHDVWTERM